MKTGSWLTSHSIPRYPHWWNMECIIQTPAIRTLQSCTSISPMSYDWLSERVNLCSFHFLPLLPTNRIHFLRCTANNKCRWHACGYVRTYISDRRKSPGGDREPGSGTKQGL